MQPVKVGDRVYFKANPKVMGTIAGFYFNEYSIYVEWDNGNDDWYKISDLVLIIPTKPIRHPCE
jgi:hypothetical protein